MHFAAHAYVGESASEPRKYFENNVRDGLTFLHAVLDSPVRKFIFSSSYAVYGTPATVPIRENTPRLPVNPYGATYIHVSDLAEAHVLGLEYLEKGSSVGLNLGSGQGHSVREIRYNRGRCLGDTDVDSQAIYFEKIAARVSRFAWILRRS